LGLNEESTGKKAGPSWKDGDWLPRPRALPSAVGRVSASHRYVSLPFEYKTIQLPTPVKRQEQS